MFSVNLIEINFYYEDRVYTLWNLLHNMDDKKKEEKKEIAMAGP